jgi:hypothetical protein
MDLTTFRLRDAARLFHSRGLSSVHWSGIRADRLSSHHGEFCKLYCSQTSREVDFFSDGSARSGEQLLNMIGMCTAFSISNQVLSIVIPKVSLLKVFQCTLHSVPPATFSVVASAHDPTKSAAECNSKAQSIKLWMVLISLAGNLSLDERRLPADTHVTFVDIGFGLPMNIYSGCRYQPTCIQISSFQLLRPDFRSLFDVESSNVIALQSALDRVRRGAVGNNVSQGFKDLLLVDPVNHSSLKSAFNCAKRSAVDADVSKDLAVLFSVDPENHEALKLALDDIKQGLLIRRDADPKYPGVIDFRNNLCHNLLTLDVRHFDALVSCARIIFSGICSICELIGEDPISKHAEQSLGEIESIAKRDIQVAPLTPQERESLILPYKQMLEERDQVIMKLQKERGRKFDSFAPCLRMDIQDQLDSGTLMSSCRYPLPMHLA